MTAGRVMLLALTAGLRLRDGGPVVHDPGVSLGEWLVFSAAEMRRRRAAFGAELERSGVSHAWYTARTGRAARSPG